MPRGPHRNKIPPVESWDQQLNETDIAFQYFQDYLHLGPQRTLGQVAIIHHCHYQNISHQSYKHNWRTRAFDFDREQDRLFALEVMDERKKSVMQVVRLADKFLQKVSRRLEEIDPRILTPRELISWYEVAVKMRRLALGEPTEVIDIEERLTIRARELGLDPYVVIEQARQLVEEQKKPYTTGHTPAPAHFLLPSGIREKVGA